MNYCVQYDKFMVIRKKNILQNIFSQFDLMFIAFQLLIIIVRDKKEFHFNFRHIHTIIIKKINISIN